MQLQVDNEFQQVQIKDLNDKYNVEMFSTAVKGGKAFAVELKIGELKSRKIKCVKDQSTTHNNNFTIDGKYKQC